MWCDMALQRPLVQRGLPAPFSTASPPQPHLLAAVWCCSVGTTWTLEVRELDRDATLGVIVDWISSGVPVSQPAPDELARELLAERGLRLIRDTSAALGTRSRHRIGYVCADARIQ